VECDDETAFQRNIVENAQRNATSPVDDALNQERLRVEQGMSDAAITRLYGYAHQASVTRLKKILALPETYRKYISDEQMTLHAATLLADECGKMDEQTLSKVWLNALDASQKANGNSDDTKVGATHMAAAIKQWRKDSAAPAPEGTTETTTETTAPATAEPVKNLGLTFKQFKDTLRNTAGDARCPDKLIEYCTVTLDYIEGKTSGEAYLSFMMSNLANCGPMKEAPPAPAAETTTAATDAVK
jgi:ParB-like chromosome segregation protein Spo0J